MFTKKIQFWCVGFAIIGATACVRKTPPASTTELQLAALAPHDNLPTLPLVLANSCPAVKERQEFRKMKAEDWSKLIKAWRQLAARPDADTPSTFDKLIGTYIQNRQDVEGYSSYFPFYRLVLHVFETELQKVDATVSLPYWDWTLDAATPAAAPIFSEQYLGGNGEPETHCVKDGPFADFTTLVPVKGECLQRQFALKPWPNRDRIDWILERSSSYDYLRQFVGYVPVQTVRQGIGGHMANREANANDPLFWLQMAFVDHLWSTWQNLPQAKENHATAINGLMRNLKTARPDSPIPGSQVKFAEVMSTEKLCYRYQ